MMRIWLCTSCVNATQTPHLLKSFIVTHTRHSIALNKDIAVREQFQRFESRSIRTHEPLPPLDEPLLVADWHLNKSMMHSPQALSIICLTLASDFDYVALHIILHYLHRLLNRYASRKQLDQVSRLEDAVRVQHLASRAHSHTALQQIQLARNAVLLRAREQLLECYEGSS
jgi:hypothetical protein